VPRDPYYSTKTDFGGRGQKKDKWYHNVGEFVLDPRNIGTAVGGYFGGAPGAAVGGGVGGMVPGVNLGPEDDARRSSLEGDFGEVVGGVTMDAARGYGGYKLGEYAGDQLQGAFADPLAEGVGIGADDVAMQGVDDVAMQDVFFSEGHASGGYPSGGQAAQAVPPTAQAVTNSLSQSAAEGGMSEWQRRQLNLLEQQGKMSTLEKAYMASQMGSTVANIYGAAQERQRYREATGPGNMFDEAMTSAFNQGAGPGVTSYQDYLKRVG
jgi:hypothetical protein